MNHAAPCRQDLFSGALASVKSLLRGTRRLLGEPVRKVEPKAVFISCSDCPVEPMVISRTRPEFLVELRTPGNLAPDPDFGGVDAATLEHAIKGLNTPFLIVCGHTDCRAMHRLLAAEERATGIHDLSSLRGVRSNLQRVEEPADIRERLDRMATENVRFQIERLRRIRFVREAEASGRLQLQGWLYRTGDGSIEIIDGTGVASGRENVEVARAA